jgi:glucose-6-phosphate isomerase
VNKNLYNQIVKNLPELESEVLKPHLQNVEAAKKQIISELQNAQIPPLNIAQKTDDLAEIKNLAEEINREFSKVVVLGVGGSSLGGKTLSVIAKNCSDKIIFMESIDSCSIIQNLEKIDLKNSLFLVISKSGETIETICQTLVFIEKFKKENIQNFSRNFIFVTQNHQNSIAKIAKEIGSKIYHHPENIGGRFSYLTIVGLLPAAICGLNISAIRNGALQILDNFVQQKTSQNQVTQFATHQLYLFEKGFRSNVIMPYIDSLKDFTDWYRQLWAESLGKNGFGSTPITSMGTVDQHSQLQLYLDGPRDKSFTFIINKNPQNNFKVIDLPNCPTLFGGKNLNDIVKVEQESTIEVLNQKQLPIRVLEVEKVDEEMLGGLMMQMFLETIILAKTQKIDPFDQPAVELRKDLAKKYLANV